VLIDDSRKAMADGSALAIRPIPMLRVLIVVYGRRVLHKRTAEVCDSPENGYQRVTMMGPVGFSWVSE